MLLPISFIILSKNRTHNMNGMMHAYTTMDALYSILCITCAFHFVLVTCLAEPHRRVITTDGTLLYYRQVQSTMFGHCVRIFACLLLLCTNIPTTAFTAHQEFSNSLDLHLALKYIKESINIF